MRRPIRTELGQTVTRRGVLKEARKSYAGLEKALHETLDGLGSYASEYMTGNADVHDWMYRARNSKGVAIDDAGTSFLLELLAGECEAVRVKKGFRYPASLSTPREHRECGSSGYALFAGPKGEYDNMPVPLANEILQLEPEKEKLTIEAVRRARELAGMPTIDEWGYVTGEVVKRGSYDFLQPNEIQAIKERERRISSALDIVASRVIGVHDADMKRFLPALRGYLRNVGEGEKRLSTPDLMDAAPHVRHAETGQYVDFYGIASGAKAVAFGLGYRDGILTPQEVLIAGRRVRPDLQPHVPIGMQIYGLDRETVARRRAEEQRFAVFTDAFAGYDYYHTISLEPLADDGSTVRGPLLVDPQSGQPWEDVMAFYKDSCKAPFARPGDWFFKG